ncbi:MAG: thioredoxin-dependent thiol peroxidase [Haliscomenobacter sp.]|nr:thioredoxin-dependent thiol peroxidase [Haliscomenobacter sp.]MBK7475228.1 thioredoxin-dependent thiol peroxidase [Haliscomenobacter sp.]MBK8879769.1 thioredoxin-dependent thiol peroxidase [Haliscomenobacter sp.]
MPHIKEGDLAPDFTVVSEAGETLTLSSFHGKKLILFFYPKDDTPGCTAESCNLRDNYSALQEKGFAILGVSPDSAAKHSKFKEKYALPFPLVPDTNQVLLKSYGAWGTKQMYGKSYEGVIRTTFVIDETGKIEKIFTKVDTKNHTEQILKALGA